MALLEVRDLSVTYRPRDSAAVRAVRDVSFTVDDGEFVGLLGESGCGKSTTGDAVLRLLEKPASITGGTITFAGKDITASDDEELRSVRWAQLAAVFQSSMNSLNPVITVGAQFADAFAAHGGPPGGDDPRTAAVGLLELVSLEPDVLDHYPHELSGGMKQRVALAMALALRPRLVVLDEPTTGLDVVVQRRILGKLRELQAELGFAVLFISHDLGTVLELADRVLVMYAGEIVEDQPAAAMLAARLHPYAEGLLSAYADPRDEEVRVGYLPGRPPDLTEEHAGCLFVARCPVAEPRCTTTHPQLLPAGAGAARCLLVEDGTRTGGGVPTGDFAGTGASRGDAEPVLSVANVRKVYRSRRTHTDTVAVDGVSFDLRPGTVTALVGQSGSGKTTLAKLITGVDRPTSGDVTFRGDRVNSLRGKALRRYRRHVQLVFQDPFAALNPTKTLRYALSRPLRNHLGLSGAAAGEQAAVLLESVGLSPAVRYLDKLPHQLSGGQRQRVVIARALAPRPDVLVADEPVSMLDVSIRAEILQLLDTLVRERGIAMLYVTHDLLSARLLADRVVVLRAGEVVEEGPALSVIRDPQHEYTRLLLDAVPRPKLTRSAG
jgi:oligopeptide/dipeptide ABC transporter ATP-binding protein